MIDGGAPLARVLGCLKPGINDTTTWLGGFTTHGIIAAQCCTAGGACARSSANVAGNDKCIAGHSNRLNGNIQRFTYAQTKERCADLDLELCQQSCRGKGCYYNNHPVYSSLPCGDVR